MVKRHRTGVCLLIIFLLTAALIAAGCQAVPGETGTTAATSQTIASPTPSIKPTTADSRPDAASGTLRLWWSLRKNLNPLLDQSQTGKDVNDLIYQGLFSVEANVQCTPLLAEKISFSPAGLVAEIKIKPDVVFHNKKKLTAADAAACINFVLDPANHSVYADSLKTVSKAEASDDLTVRLYLKQHDPWLAYSLTFPIIPEKNLTAKPFALVPGTGPFMMKSYSAKNGLTLTKVKTSGDQSELKTIRLIEYVDLSAAMKAYENDKIDLVNLPADNYSQYMMRDTLRFEQYSGNHLLFLAYNTQRSQLLSDDARFLYLKTLLNAEKFAKAGADIWGESTMIPLSETTWSLTDYTADNSKLLKSIGKAAWTKTTNKLHLLVLTDNECQMSLMKIICSMLDKAGIKWNLEKLAAAEYWTKVKAHQYDLILLDAIMPNQPDPSWLYKTNRPAAYAILNSLDSNALKDYDLWRQRLIQTLLAAKGGQLPNGKDYAEQLYQTAARSYWDVLMIRTGALVYGDRIIGQCKPDKYHPYRGIEELWIWSGQ